MYISELAFTVDKHGGIKIPAFVLKKMGLLPGDHLRVAYLTQDGSANVFREFMLLPDTIEKNEAAEDAAIRIPAQLMEQTNIPPNADLQIACLDGALVICRDSGFQPEELRSVLEGLETVENLTSILPEDAQQALLELERLIHTVQEGAEANE